MAIVHDWLFTYAGAERVLEQLLALFPQADLFAVCDFVPERQRDFLAGRKPKTTFIQGLPSARKWLGYYLPLMPLAIERLDLSEYDLVVSSSFAVAKGVPTQGSQLHISYVHTPIRYAWDEIGESLRGTGFESGLRGWLARALLRRIREWDRRSARRVDLFIANSRYISQKIATSYRREAKVIYPPVDVEAFGFVAHKKEYYLAGSRFVPYKCLDIIVEAFKRMPNRRLVLVGDGPERPKIERAAAGYPNIDVLGYQTAAAIARYMGEARAFVFAAKEDFGIMPVEAQACGTPVIAFGQGGALETIRGLDQDRPTGVFFEEQTSESIIAAVERFEARRGAFEAAGCRANAARFSGARFHEQFRVAVARAMAEHGSAA